MNTITSTANAQIKRLRALYKDKKLRFDEDVFVCEGKNFIKDIPSDITVEQLFIKESELSNMEGIAAGARDIYVVSDSIFDSVADTVTPSGIIAVAKRKEEQRDFSKEQRVLLLCGISDAGNMGTIIRTAAANGIQTVICADCVEPYNPKAVRASMCGIFYVNIIICDYNRALELLSEYSIVALDMNGQNIESYARAGKIAIAVGSEAHGVPEIIKKEAKVILSIPMQKGTVESLNAAVSAGIAMYLIK